MAGRGLGPKADDPDLHLDESLTRRRGRRRVGGGRVRRDRGVEPWSCRPVPRVLGLLAGARPRRRRRTNGGAGTGRAGGRRPAATASSVARTVLVLNRLATRSMFAVTRLPSATTPGSVANLLSISTSSATALVAGPPRPVSWRRSRSTGGRARVSSQLEVRRPPSRAHPAVASLPAPPKNGGHQ